jgi:hypothetical protein
MIYDQLYQLSYYHLGIIQNSVKCKCRGVNSVKLFLWFNAWIIRLVGQTKRSVLLKIQWKQHHYSYTKFVYNGYNYAS